MYRAARFIPAITALTFATPVYGVTKCQSNDMSADSFFSNPQKYQPRVTVQNPQFNTSSHARVLTNPKYKSNKDNRNNVNFKPGQYKFLVFGETGCGKSTLINVLTSYFKNGTLERPRVSIPTMFHKSTEWGVKHTERNIKDRTKAQTDRSTEYKFNHGKANFSIIDTPGLNDTEGYEQDERNIDIIMNAAINAKGLSAIVLIINGSNARATDNIKSLLHRFKGCLPNSIMDNIIVVFTMCNAGTCNFTDIEQFGIQPANVFYMNNCAFSQDPRTWTDDVKPVLKHEWNNSMNVCTDFLTEISNMSKISTADFERLKKIRNHVKTKLHEAQVKIKEIQKIQDEIANAISAAKRHSATAEQFKDYTVQKTVTKQQLVDVPYHSTLCGDCSKVCHDHCGLDEMPDKDPVFFTNCACMGAGNKCSKCGCGPETHYHARKSMQDVQVTLDEEIKDLKDKFLAATKDLGDAEKKMSDQEMISKSIDAEIDKILDDIINDCVELKKLCTGYNLVHELNDLINKLKQSSLMLTSTEALETSQLFIKSLEDLCNRFQVEDKAENLKRVKTKKKSKASELVEGYTKYRGELDFLDKLDDKDKDDGTTNDSDDDSDDEKPKESLASRFSRWWNGTSQ